MKRILSFLITLILFLTSSYCLATDRKSEYPTNSSSIDASKYSKIDPEYKENMDLISNNINKTRDKEIFASKFGGTIDFYRVIKGSLTLDYYGNGSLKEITIDSQKEPPLTSYIYNPNGVLKGFMIITSSRCMPKMFSSSGGLVPFDSYVRNIQKKIKANWKPCHYQFPDSYSATVLFKLNKNGKLLDYELIKKSPNKDYNEAAINALKKAAPLIIS